MIIPTLLVLAVIFSVAAIILSYDDPSQNTIDGTGELPFWIRYGHR
jgi:hypothetical protein